MEAFFHMGPEGLRKAGCFRLVKRHHPPTSPSEQRRRVTSEVFLLVRRRTDLGCLGESNFV